MSNAAQTADWRVSILGVGVSVVRLDEAVATVERWIRERSRQYVCVTGTHGIMESRCDARLRHVLNDAGMVTADGMPLVWLSRLMGSRAAERVYGPDLMRAVSAISTASGYRHFYYGGPPGLAETLRDAMQRAYPGILVAGLLSPPFHELTPDEDAAVVARINAASPDIVWVGLSTPKQELWMARHLGRIDAPVMIGVGAAFDFLAGTKRQAPRWMQRSGLEWLFRLASEPRRLWRRYVYVVPGFAVLATGELLARLLGFGKVRGRTGQ